MKWIAAGVAGWRIRSPYLRCKTQKNARAEGFLFRGGDEPFITAAGSTWDIASASSIVNGKQRERVNPAQAKMGQKLRHAPFSVAVTTAIGRSTALASAGSLPATQSNDIPCVAIKN
jgi:hypothetical protein